MAASAPIQSLVGNPLLRATPKQHFQWQQRTGRSVLVRCQTEDKKLPETRPSQRPEIVSEGAPPQTPKSPPKKVSTKFADVLAFSGPVSKQINGRLAMVGFAAAIGVEIAKGDGLMA